jgi:putative PEP-CTERM system histidine kinase
MTPIEASATLHAAAAALCLLWGGLALLLGRWRLALLPALFCAAGALWAATIALVPQQPLGGWAGLAEVLRNGCAVALLVALAQRLGGARAGGLSRRFVGVGAALVLLAATAQLLPFAATAPGLGEPLLLVRLALALFIVVLAENIARNADEAAGWHVNLPCIALAGLAAFDLVLYAEAALSGGFSATLLNARGALAGLVPSLLVLAALRDRRWRRPPAVSREVVFHGATLLLAGAFLMGVGLAGEALRWLSEDWGGTAQAGLVAGALLALLVALSSRSFRSRVRRLVVDHFFAARYDYRAEWLRCAATLSDASLTPPRRAIRAVADAVDVPAGVLLLRPQNEPGLRWAGSWNRPDAGLGLAPGHALMRRLAAATAPLSLAGEACPEDVRAAFGELWLAVPLRQGAEGEAPAQDVAPQGELLGAVLLAAPRAPFPLDDEARALLMTLGREVALFLAERQAAERLAEGRQLAEYAQRFAFVAHDVKTVSNQLRLMLDNAEGNIADPEFQSDLLTTMRASVARIDTLIERLRHEDAAAEGAFAVAERLRAIARARPGVALEIEADGPLPLATMPPENFDAAVTHLLNNAAEASPPAAPVRLVVRPQDGALELDIIDHGPGMSAEFIRDELFRPLATTKVGGSGIGAWQARELLTRAGGALAVISAPGAGTTMRLRIPARRVA